MNPLSPCFVRRVAGVFLACSLPFAALAAPSPKAAASQPHGPTIDADIGSKCNQMTGDERTACERDIRAAAKKRHRGSRTTTHAAAASAAS